MSYEKKETLERRRGGGGERGRGEEEKGPKLSREKARPKRHSKSKRGGKRRMSGEGGGEGVPVFRFAHPSGESEIIQVHLVGHAARRVDLERPVPRLRGEQPRRGVEEGAAHQQEPLALQAPRVHPRLSHKLHLGV